MPELPDLEVFSHNLHKKLSGKKLEKLTVVNGTKLKTPAASFKKELESQELEKVFRDGKELHFRFANGQVLGLHLMLHGQLFLFDGKNDHNHAIIELHFDDGTGLALCDYQGAATPTLNPEPKEAPDALSARMSLPYLKECLSGTRATIKNVLLDQHIIRGIGNAYADEILWDARISPFSQSNKIPEDKVKDLAESIRSVLHHAQKQIIKNKPDTISGEFRDFLNVHHTRKTHSPTGAPILRKDATRKTYYTEEQELYK